MSDLDTENNQCLLLEFKRISCIVLLFSALSFFTMKSFAKTEPGLLDHTLETIFPKGEINLNQSYAGKVLLVVNTASGCGFTPQYEGLEKLYQKYKDQGLVVLGFPSNDFFQERKDETELVEFCRLNYGVSFPIFKKSAVTGEKANLFYKSLILESNGQAPKWNFFKYLIDQKQQLVGLFPSQEKPLGGKLERQIENLLDMTN